MQNIIRRVVVHGKVQGVGFRAWTQYKAGRRDLDGWVRNLRDGTVEAVFAGPVEVVAAMIADCERGPRAALVIRIDQFDSGQAELALRGSEPRFVELETP
jgi:acylphosphatase